MNWRIQTLFEKWMEPMEALAWKLTNRPYDYGKIWYASDTELKQISITYLLAAKEIFRPIKLQHQ